MSDQIRRCAEEIGKWFWEVSQEQLNNINWIEKTIRLYTAPTPEPRLSVAIQKDEDELVDEVQRRMDAVVDAAVEWATAEDEEFDRCEILNAAIDSLLQLRDKPEYVAAQPPAEQQRIHQQYCGDLSCRTCYAGQRVCTKCGCADDGSCFHICKCVFKEDGK